ncbi:MAG: tetratricopeptide repeat protein [Bacteroidota bacterium]
MKPAHQKSLSRILLISFFLQSCGLEVPISEHQPEGAVSDGVQQLETTSGGSAAPSLSAAELQPHSSFVGSHERSAQSLPGPSAAIVQDGPEGVVEEEQPTATELTEVDKLFNAIHDGGTDAVNQLLSTNQELLEVLSERDDGAGRKQGYTLLMYAAHLGSEPMVRLLLSWKPKVNIANKDGLTALHMAAEKGHLAVVKCIKEERAQLDSTSDDGRTPMHLAAQNGHLEVVEYLDKNGATSDVRDGSGLTAFYLASSAGHTSVKDYLLQRVIDKRYADLVKAMDEGKVQEVNEVIASLSRLIDKVEKRTETAKRYIDQLTQELGATWWDTFEGRSVISKLKLLVQESSDALLLKDATQAFTISESRENRTKLIDVLLQLASLHQEQGKALGDLSYYTDAATCYQHVLSICGGEDATMGYELQTNLAHQGLLAIRKALVPNSSLDEIVKVQEEIARDKQELEGLRVYARVEADELEGLLNQRSTPAEERANEATYIQRSKELFHDIAERIKAFLARLYLESEQELGPAPCKYTVMGLGSMALQQMTPYSDLEFALLMEKCSDSESARLYFEHLTHLVNFRVINLGETNIPKDKYDVGLDHLVRTGINLDLGGKTPLGRRDKPYKLIQTVAGMLHYLRNEGNRVEHIDKNLPYILESTCYVHGNKQLHEAYKTQKIEFLSDPVIYKARAMQRMLEGIVEWDYTHPDVVGPSKKQRGNIEEFRLQFSGKTGEDQGKLYDVKKEIYRLPDRLLYGLAFYYGIIPGSGWHAVEKLFEREIIRLEAVQHLGYIMSFANMLRLKTYLHYGQQKEGLTMLGGLNQEEAQGEIRRTLCLPEEALQTDGSLFKYYYTAIPLHGKIEAFFDKLDIRRKWMRTYAEGSPDLEQVIEELSRERVLSTTEETNFFSEDPFRDDSAQVKGDIHLRLLQKRKAVIHHTEVLRIKRKKYGPKHSSVATTLNNLGNVHSALGEHAQSLRYYREALEIKKEVYGPRHSSVAGTLHSLGIVHRDLGKHAQSLKYYREALEIRKEVYGPRHSRVAETLHNLGIVHGDLGEHAQSLRYYREALEIMQEVYGPRHSSVASTLNNLGLVHRDLGEHAQSLRYYREALEISQEVYGPRHSSVADTLHNLGIVHRALGEHAQSLSYDREALGIRKEVYGPKHPRVAETLNSLGAVHGDLGEHAQSLRCFREALETNKEVYGPRHSSVADTLNNLGAVHGDLGEHAQSLTYCREALAIMKEVYGPKHPSVATTLNNLGAVHRALGKHAQSLTYHREALETNKEVYGPRHSSVAETLNNLGAVHRDLGEHAQSLRYLREALEISQEVHGPRHSSVAETLHNLGLVHSDLGEYAKSMVYFEEALAIIQQVYSSPEHPQALTILRNLETLRKNLGSRIKSIGYLEEELAIRKQFYHEPHPSIARNLQDLGNVHSDLGEREKSVVYYEAALQMYQLLGGILQHLNQHAQAVEYFEQTLEIGKKLHGDVHPDVASVLYSLAVACCSSEQLQKSIAYYEEALSVYQQLSEDNPENPYASTRASISHNLACMYHIEAQSTMQKDRDQTAQEYINKAKETFTLAIAANNPPTASLCTEYANFLLATRQLEQAYPYLQRAITIGDDKSGLSYSMLEIETITPALREKISQDNSISLRSLDYAYYLLIHHYEDFQEAGISLEKTQEVYMQEFQKAVEQRAHQQGREKQGEIASYLLESLHQESGIHYHQAA